MKRLFLVALGIGIGMLLATSLPSFARLDQHTYDNLMRSRDALLSQQDYLQREYNQVSDQVNLLQDKLQRINSYLKQTQDALRDVNYALQQ